MLNEEPTVKFQHFEERRAAKEYRCPCGRAIPKGERYEYGTVWYEGEECPRVYRTHLGRCWEDE